MRAEAGRVEGPGAGVASQQTTRHRNCDHWQAVVAASVRSIHARAGMGRSRIRASRYGTVVPPRDAVADLRAMRVPRAPARPGHPPAARSPRGLRARVLSAGDPVEGATIAPVTAVVDVLT